MDELVAVLLDVGVDIKRIAEALERMADVDHAMVNESDACPDEECTSNAGHPGEHRRVVNDELLRSWTR